ncbi:MAG TPA: helix-turn-helix transcriptional regulator, partial [Micromonosporaceae bacterium]
RYDDMLAAARQGSANYLAIGSAYQALQLAELGLEEAADDPDLLATAAHAAWLAGLVDDATAHSRRWQGVARTQEEQAAALNLRVRVAWSVQDLDLMSTLSDELRAAQEHLPPGREQAQAMATLAQSARLRDLDDEALAWSSRAIALTESVGDLPGVRLAALAERASLLAGRADTVDEGRALLARTADEAEAQGEWLVAALALNRLIHLPSSLSWQALADRLERMRQDAERAGSEVLAVAAYYQGRARVAMQQGNLAAAIEAIERGRAHDLGYRRSVTPSDVHGVFLAGLRLESGDLAGAAQITADLSGVPGIGSSIPGLAFHLACRQGRLERARALLPEVIASVQATGGRSGDFLHDLVSAALAAPLPVADVDKLVAGLDGPTVDPAYRQLVTAQMAQAHADPGRALTHYRAAADADILPPAPRGTAHLGAASVLIALNRREEARAHARAAAGLLGQWAGWRVEQLASMHARLGLAADGGTGTGMTDPLTPREREVAALIAQGLTNTELATKLFISPRTAAVHVSSILRKLGVTSRTEVGDVLMHRPAEQSRSATPSAATRR